MLKKIVSVVTFLSLFSAIGLSTFSMPVMAQSSNAVLFLSAQDQEVAVGNRIYYRLVLNTLGNDIEKIDAQFLIKGPFDTHSGTFTLDPDHSQKLFQSSPFVVERYQKYAEDNGTRVHVILRSTGNEPFNEGSSAIPVFLTALTADDVGEIKAYIDGAHTTIQYTDPSRQDYENYSTEANARVITVLESMANSGLDKIELNQVVVNSPQPDLIEEEIPKASPVSEYDQEFEELSTEVERLSNELENQGQRLSFLERAIQSIQDFFNTIF